MTDQTANLPSVADALAKQTDFAQDWQALEHALTADAMHSSGLSAPTGAVLQHYIDGKTMACPLPLLKLKIALKTTACGDCVYLTATDPNSEHDIGAFCRMAGHGLLIAHTPASDATLAHNGQNAATIIHLLITKNC